MTKALICLSFLISGILAQPGKPMDYIYYHKTVVAAESLIAEESYEGALRLYEGLFDQYDFVFLRDYQIATQLALFLNDEVKAQDLLLNAIQSGWTIKSIRHNHFMDDFRKNEYWKSVEQQYDSLRQNYEDGLNQALRERVEVMFAKDQKRAVRALFRFGSKAQNRYAERKFAPHSEQQLADFAQILAEFGYPGERLIGNSFWMSTILSHHNSISMDYNLKDTLYKNFGFDLLKELQNGRLSAFEFVLIDEWRRATLQHRNYGILEGPLAQDLRRTNKLRSKALLRSIEVHNKLVELQEKTGMNFYLEGHPWEGGKIEIRAQ